MKFLILLLTLVVFPLAYAEQSITLDKSQYVENDSIKISGKVSFQDGLFVILQIRSPSNIVAIDQFIPNHDGTFSKSFLAQGPKWTESGKYTVIVTYDRIKSEKSFDFNVSLTPKKVATPKVEPPEPGLPTWVKSYAKKWHDGDVSDRQFLAGVSELIKENFINVDSKYVQENDEIRTIPDWFKNTALWYYDGMISDDDYFYALEFLIKEKFLII